MSRSLVLFIYNLLLPVFFIVAFPAWLLKMWKRGGYGTGLMERFGSFSIDASEEPRDVIYIHAVSVGEVFIALKLIKQWLQAEPNLKVVLAATTSTGHAVARENALAGVRVIYSPLDFNMIVTEVLSRFQPRQIVLIEAEVWPNFVNVARQMKIPVAMINARLSKRSELRFHKFAAFVEPLFEMIDLVCVQNKMDAVRFAKLGINKSQIHVTGSVKFDPSSGSAPQKRAAFQEMLADFAVHVDGGKHVVLLASSHDGEERMLADAVRSSGADALLVIVPRHAERRAQVTADLESSGFEVVLSSQYCRPNNVTKACLVIDTTGELCDWTAHADLVVIGKSWLAHGGQNPAEAIAAEVPVITGPHMQNFEPLVSMLREADGIVTLSSADELAHTVKDLLADRERVDEMCRQAKKALATHENAVQKTIKLLNMNASVRGGIMQEYYQDHE
jgi:3-deoxy-D-manno-octulosonic-acid transferase